MVDPVIDANGWRRTDEVLPANRETVLIWHDVEQDVQFAQFLMYSERRYEFVQGTNVVSIHHVEWWQPQPKGPIASIVDV